jgi:hypothetical protein
MRRTVRQGLIDYLIADDDPQPYDARWWAVLRTRAVDELTGEPPLNRISIGTTTRGCLPRIADGGLCGLVARPSTVSGPLVTPGELTAEIRVDGYLPRSLTAAIDAARRSTTTTAPGDTQVTIAPPEPTPPAPRQQFIPGRGVMLETRTVNEPQEFTIEADPATAPAPNVVPLVDPVRDTRAAAGAPWRVVGVPIVLPDQPLHRAEPALVRGRARRLPPGTQAVPVDAPDSFIAITGVWWTYAEIPASSNPPHLPDLVTFAAPLAFDHASGGLARLTVRTPDGLARTLARPAAAGESEIELSDVTGLAIGGGDTLELEATNSAERELVYTDSYDPPSGSSRAVVRLAAPLAFPHAVDTPVMNVVLTFAALGNLAREAQRGDRVLFASTLASVATDDVLRINGGPAGPELRFVRRFPLYDPAGGPLLTDKFKHQPAFAADGSFALPPIARVAQMQLFVAHDNTAAYPPIDLVPDYRGDTTLQIMFKP